MLPGMRFARTDLGRLLEKISSWRVAKQRGRGGAVTSFADDLPWQQFLGLLAGQTRKVRVNDDSQIEDAAKKTGCMRDAGIAPKFEPL
jgi:hypothetical protein